MNKFDKVYMNNKLLDEMFKLKYSNDENLFKKNCVEFLVEFGEFINETKCFKYWTIKKPDKNQMLEEFADCMTMVLYFYNNLNLDLSVIDNHYNSTDIFEIINYIYLEGTNLINNYDEKCVRSLFSNLLYLSNLLGLKEDEIIEIIEYKQKVIRNRLNSDY